MTLWKRAPKDVERGDPTSAKETTGRPPYFLRLRSSTAFISFTVGLGIMTDLAGYSLIVPIVPFRLQALNYTSISSKTGWLVTAFSAGLIASAPPISYLGHKIRARRGPLIFGLVFMMGGIVLFMETSNYAAMVASRILQGVSGSMLWILGLVVIIDSVPQHRIGEVMGQVMIGFSVGNAIGPPVGGILAERMGYRSPFVFALCLLFVDLVLRILIVEKHVALQWIQKGVEIPGFEAPGYTPEPTSPTTSSATSIPVNVTTSAPTTTPAPEANVEGGQEDDLSDEKKESTEGTARHYAAFLDMLVNPRALASFALALFYGGVIGGTLDTGLTLWLENEYHLSSQGAGLVFLGAIVPIMFVSPVAGWASDRFGAKPIAVIGVVLSIPSYALLLIKGPLPLFIFFLALFGSSMAIFITPVLQDLSHVVNLTPGLPPTAAYGMFHITFSIGTFVGPIIAGQVMNDVKRGWTILCSLNAGMAALLLPVTVIWLGGRKRREERKEEVEKETRRDDDELSLRRFP